MSKVCLNPICEKKLTSDGKPKRDRRFCSSNCRSAGWAFRRVRELIGSLSSARKLEILEEVASSPTNGNEPDGTRKTYICSRWPRLRVGKRVKFNGGIFETENLEVQRLIESLPEYGVHILDGHLSKST